MSTFPATNGREATELIIDSGNQLHEIVNEDATTEVLTESGYIPSVRKALADTFLFQEPIPWQQGSDETAFNQLRTFNDDIYWAPTATTLNPIPMGATPIGDSNWSLAPVNPRGYKGLWPDTGGSALKGQTYQTQVGGTPTGDYYTALKNTTVDPVGDDVNWRQTSLTKSLILSGLGKNNKGFWDENPVLENKDDFVVDRNTGNVFGAISLPYQVDSTTHPDPNALVPSELRDVSEFITVEYLKNTAGVSRYSAISITNLYRFSISSVENITPGQRVAVKMSGNDDLLSSFVVASNVSGGSTEVLINDALMEPTGVEYVVINAQSSVNMARNKFSSSPLSKVGAGVNNLVILGDSITEGVGASQFGESYIHKLSGGLSNKMYFDLGGVSYPSYYNMATALSSGGVSSTGTLGYDNVSPSRDVYLSLNAGNSIKIQWRNLAKIAFTYSDASSCNISISVNGNQIKSLTLTNSS